MRSFSFSKSFNIWYAVPNLLITSILTSYIFLSRSPPLLINSLPDLDKSLPMVVSLFNVSSCNFSATYSVLSYGSDALSADSLTNDFKFNFGANSELINSLAIRSPYVSSSSRARCLQVASYDKKEEIDFSKKGTFVSAKNLTFLNETENLKADIDKGLVKEAIYVGHTASLEMNKSVISGFNPAVLLEDKIDINQENLEKIKFANMYFNNCNGNIFVENNTNNEDLENWYGNTSFFNVYSKSNNVETFIDFANEKKPDFRLRINKIMASKDHLASEDLGLDN